MQPCEMASPVGVQHRTAGFMKNEVYYPSLHPQYDGPVLQKRERKLIAITDPDDCSRDMMAELYGMKISSLRSITVEAPVPQKNTHPVEAEPSIAPASETKSQKKTREPVKFFIPLTEEENEKAKEANIAFGDSLFDHQALTGGDIVETSAPLQATPPKALHKRPGLLLFSIPPEEVVEQEMEKVQKTKSQKKTREPVIFFIPLTEEEKEQVKKADITFGDFLFEYQTLTGGDIVEASTPSQTTPPKGLHKRPGLLLFSIPPQEEVEQKTEKVQKTKSEKKTRVPVIFFIPLMEEEKEQVKKADITFGDFLFEYQTLTGGDIVEASTPSQTTPPKGPHKRPGLLLFSIPPQEEVEQKTEKVQKTKSEKKTREPGVFFITLLEEEKEQVQKANITFSDFLFEYQTLTEGDIVEAPAPNTADNTPEPAPVEVHPSEPHCTASSSVPTERKKYDREFLLRLEFDSFSMRRPVGLPFIPSVVLDKCELEKPRKIITSMSLNNDVKLSKAEKAWKPAVKKFRGDEVDQEMVKTQELFQKVRSILNKLTPQMFEQLRKRFMQLTIDTEERLTGVVDLIFEKAISEPSYSLTYANLCRCFVGLKVPTSDNSGATVKFFRLLLNRCQKEFEKDNGDDEISRQKQKELDAATEEEVQQRVNEARHRSLGNIRFIGELFKQEMMVKDIMLDCIVKLLKNVNEESLEVLCKLLSTIGKKLDVEVSEHGMDQYFQQMEQIVKERKTSSRIRFMMQDVLDLRKNNWVPRRGDQGPKTIDQIHKDAELEEQKELIKVQQLFQSKKNTCQERRGERNQPQDMGRNPSRTMKQTIDKPRLTEPDAGQQAICTLNRFSVLQDSEPSSTSCSTSLDKCRVPQVQGLDKTAICKLALSEEEVEKKTAAIIEEYLHINDLKEAVQCVEELNSASVLFIFVRTAVELVLDRTAVARERIGLLLHRLVITRILPPNQYFKGLQEILEVADDMAIDIPHIWQYLAEIITPMLHDGGIHVGLLFRAVTKPLLPIGKAAVLLVHILNRLNHNEAGDLWVNARLNWQDFLPEDEDVNKFVTEQKVEFTLGRRPKRSS